MILIKSKKSMTNVILIKSKKWFELCCVFIIIFNIFLILKILQHYNMDRTVG